MGEPRETGAGTPVRLAKIQRAEDVQDKDIGPGGGGGGGLEQRITWEVQLSGLMTVEEEERGTSDDTQASRLNPGVAVGTSKGTDSGEGDELGGDILEGGI